MLTNNKQITDQFDLKFHIALLGTPLLLLIVYWSIFFNGISQYQSILTLTLVCIIYILGYSLSYYLHQGRLSRANEHLHQMHHINAISLELVHFANQYENEASFLNALLKKAVSCINGAEMGTIIRIDPNTKNLFFESSVGIDLNKLRRINFNLEQSFEHRFTHGKCDRVVIIDDMTHINDESTLNKNEQMLLSSAPIMPICSTLSSPIHIDGELYGLLNLDSGSLNAFNQYDCHLVELLTHEAANVINIYHKSKAIQKLTFRNQLTQLYNQQGFEKKSRQWKLKPHFGSYLLLIKIKNLNAYNKHEGYQAGDKVIQLLSHHLQALWLNEAIVAYFGGNEFIILCHGPEQQLEYQLKQLGADIHNASIDANIEPITIKYGIGGYQKNWKTSYQDARKMLKQDTLNE
ncbi:diguanylate cyclase [uncultured Shewanella sp.]|uniref:diguanylate cyclase domain-containing protein n=1 Tax=uncultured Shewanella sp. TaxID=173975 RepID=UPI0026283CB2|nr:diguanylate cyclase [uncultured Shewanella sp.]